MLHKIKQHKATEFKNHVKSKGEEMNSTIKDLIERRSYRSYKPEQIKDDELKTVMDAACNAPCGMGKYPYKIVVIQNKEDLAALEKINAEITGNPEGHPFYGAPTAAVVLVDPEASQTAMYDGTLVLGNMLNAAYSLGLAACWIHRAKETFERPDGKEFLKKWGLSENLVGIGYCILGYPGCAKPEGKEKPELVIYDK